MSRSAARWPTRRPRGKVVLAPGNVSGVAAVEDAIKPAQAAPDPDKIYPGQVPRIPPAA